MRRSSFATRISVLPIAIGLAIAGTAFTPQASMAAPGDVGYEGPSFAGATGAVTGEKPESKLWFNDGTWWASMWSASGGYTIHRLDIATQTWADTGTALDPRSSSRADALWDTSTAKLYVASHVYSSSGSSTTTANSARLYRYSYNASNDQYTLDAAFPVTINGARSESLILDRDSTGQLWITWTQGSQVWVNRSLCNPNCDDATWGSPFVPAVNAVHPNSTTVSSDDISSLASLGGRIGLMWGNQVQEAWYFAIHEDTAADTLWAASQQAFQGANEADDHVHLATLQSDGDGRVFVAVKTSINSSNQPAIKVLERSPVSGTWLSHTVSTGQYDQTRPIVLVDETSGVIHVFSSDESGGGIYHKAAPLSNIHFADGKGTLVMWDDSSHELNDASSTKQNVSSASGLVVLASNNVTDRYWHSYDPLTGAAPVASFTGTPTSGAAPLVVNFTDTSTNGPTSWAWDFDSNGSVDSTDRNPVYTYAVPGTYNVTLTATNLSGTDTQTLAGYVVVGGTGGTSTFTPTADAKVNSSSSTRNFGTTTDLRVRNASSNSWNSYLRFNLSGLSGTVTSATLRLFVTASTASGGGIYRLTPSAWTETGITWANAPPITGSALDTRGAVTAGTWVEWNVSSAVTGNGVVELALRNTGGSGTYSSREGPNRPQLVVSTTGSPPPPPLAPVAGFSGTPTSGSVPLLVGFTDTSTNEPTSWAWDFDNDGTVDSTARNPQHTYSAAGTYSVTLTATNASGADSETRTDYIVVGTTQPPPPVAGFSGTPTSGTAPLVVSFTDSSTNAPTSWAWDFDSNGTIDSTSQNPQHTYAAPGSFSVTLTATNAGGTDSETRAGYIVVGGGGGTGGTATFAPAADAKVSSDNPTKNYGTVGDLRVRTSSSNSWNSYLRFNVSGLSGSVASATLRLYVTGATASGGGIFQLTPSAWSETGITWANAPTISGSALDTRGAVTVGTWVEWDVTDAVTGNGVLELALRNTGGSGTYSSREGANPPQLVVVTGG